MFSDEIYGMAIQVLKDNPLLSPGLPHARSCTFMMSTVVSYAACYWTLGTQLLSLAHSSLVCLFPWRRPSEYSVAGTQVDKKAEKLYLFFSSM